MLILIVALGGVIQHGRTALKAQMPSQNLVVAASVSEDAETAASSWVQDLPDAGLSDPGLSDGCLTLCLGIPALWSAAAQIAPDQSGSLLRWPLTAARGKGRLVAPGYQPPRLA